jgi:ankyrin repeat protein
MKASRRHTWLGIVLVLGCGDCSGKRIAELTTAADKGDAEAIKKLVNDGVNVNSRISGGVTPLMHCLMQRNKEGFRALLENGADPNVIMQNGRTVMHVAAMEDSLYLQEALAHGGDPDLLNKGNRSSPGRTPLFEAVAIHTSVRDPISLSHPENVRLLIASGADVNHKNDKGTTPLSLAAECGQYEAMFMLLEAGADFRTIRPPSGSWESWVDSQGKHKWEFLGDQKDSRQYYVKVCEFLAAHGVKVQVPEDEETSNEGE